MIELEIGRIGMDREEYISKTTSDWWLYGIQSILNNVADGIVSYGCSPAIIEQKIGRNETFYGMDFHIQYHRCPLFKEIDISVSELSQFFQPHQYPSKIKEWKDDLSFTM